MSRRRCCCGGSTPYGTWKVWVPSCNATYWETIYQESPAAGVAGMVCELYAESGRTTLVASGTTNSVGRVNIPVPSAAIYYPRFTHPNGRFAALNPGSAANFTSSTTVTGLYRPNAASGYACSGICRIPIATTLYASTPIGDVTLTWVGGRWEGTKMTTPVGTATCPSVAPLALVAGFNGANGDCSIGGGWKSNLTPSGNPPCVGVNGACPCDAAWPGSVWATPTSPITSLSCPPSAFAFTASRTWTPAATSYGRTIDAVFGVAASYTHTYTVTE